MPFDGIGYESRSDVLEKMDKVIDLLSHEDRWCKQQLRSYDGRRCILGAMMAADATIALKDPILLAIRQVTGHDCRRIEMFNDHPLTTHSTVVRILNQARTNILVGTTAPAPARVDTSVAAWWGTPAMRLRKLFA